MDEKDMKSVETETLEFLDGLGLAELRRLLDIPVFGETVVEHAAECELLSRRVDEVLDAEFQQMTPEQQKRINRLANKLSKKHTPKHAQPGWLKRQWRIVAAGTRKFGGAEPALIMGAHQKSEPGWPFELAWAEGETQCGQRLEFNLWGVDLIVKNTSAVGTHLITLEVKSTGRTVWLKPGEKQSLGDIEEFGLTDSSDQDEIANVLDTMMEVGHQTA